MPAQVRSLFQSLGVSHKIVTYPGGGVIFSQGSDSAEVMYLEVGAVKLTVTSRTGKQAIVCLLQPGDFFGEGCLAGQRRRMATAVAVSPSTVTIIEQSHLSEMLHRHLSLNDQFLMHMLTRNIRIEEDLIDQLFNTVERRLARTLLLLARSASQDGSPQQIVPKPSQETLAEIIGATRGRVSFFMNKFRKSGLIEYNGGITVHPGLLSAVLRD